MRLNINSNQRKFLCNAIRDRLQKAIGKEYSELAEIYNKLHPKMKKKEVIKDIRESFKVLCEVEPLKAQKLANEMELIEGKEFRDIVLDGLAPFDNPKKYRKKIELG